MQKKVHKHRHVVKGFGDMLKETYNDKWIYQIWYGYGILFIRKMNDGRPPWSNACPKLKEERVWLTKLDDVTTKQTTQRQYGKVENLVMDKKLITNQWQCI